MSIELLLMATTQGLLSGIMALGAYISYRVLDFPDLSVDGTYVLGASISAALIVRGGWHPIATLPIAMLGGMVGGLVTALLTTKLKIVGLLSGILTMLGLYSINLRIMGGANIPLLTTGTIYKSLKTLLPLPLYMLGLIVGGLFCLLFILLMYWFFGTELGCGIRAAGDNAHMARAVGINTDNMVILGLMLSNGMVALAGALVAQYQGYSDVKMGSGTMVIGLASIIIGSVIFRFVGNSFGSKLIAAVLGSVLYRIIFALVIKLGLAPDDMNLITCLLVIVALSVPLIQQRLNRGKATKGGSRHADA